MDGAAAVHAADGVRQGGEALLADGAAAHLAPSERALGQPLAGGVEGGEAGLGRGQQGRHPGPLEADARPLDVVLVVGRVGRLGLDDPGQLGLEVGDEARRRLPSAGDGVVRYDSTR
jgi:hypothetical protein